MTTIYFFGSNRTHFTAHTSATFNKKPFVRKHVVSEGKTILIVA